MRTRLDSLRPYIVALGLTFVASGLIAIIRARTDVSNVSMLYLLAVLAAAVLYGTWPAVMASVVAFLSYDFFFVRPQHTFYVADEGEWLGLGLLLATGIVTGRLAAALRDRARDAALREREARVLYDVVRLMSQPELDQALRAVAERLRSELNVSAVTITFATGGAVQASAESGDPDSVVLAREALRLPDMLLASGPAPAGTKPGGVGRWIRIVPPTAGSRRSERIHSVPFSLHGQRAGALVLVARSGVSPFGREVDRVLSIVSNQLGLALERLALQREANETEALRRTNELRTALMNAVSHDLRTPLSSIIASVGSLLQNDVSWTDDDRQQFLTAIEREAERLNRLVSNLLDLSRIQGGSLRPEKSWYELGSLIREVAGRLAFLAVHHEVVVDVPDELPPMLFDYVELDQVVTNLIENAIKHTPAGTEITLTARVAGDQARVDIADNGPGISDEELPRLFEAFYRGAKNAVRPQGSGLGLTGFRVELAETGQAALDAFARGRPDLALLDLGLPDIDGAEVIRRVRETDSTPIIVLSVREGEGEKVRALDLGADDYLTKPFGVDELLARIRVALRHAAKPPTGADPIFTSGDLDVDREHRRVRVAGEDVRLTPTEYELLQAFISRPDRVLTDRMLLQEVWGPEYGSEAHYLHVYVARLRKKIEGDPQRPRHLVTEPGVGYRFVTDYA